MNNNMKKDIKNTELDDYSMDIVILSLAMWESNCKEYITYDGVYRILIGFYLSLKQQKDGLIKTLMKINWLHY